MAPTTTPKEEEGLFHLLPLGLAVLGGATQLFSCGTRLVNLGVPVGFALSVAAVAFGHFVLWRRWRGGAQGRWLAWLALASAYISLLIIPIVGYGILFIIMRGGH